MRRLTAGILLVLALLAGACPARADKATSFTYTLNEKRRHVRTQDAYLPDKTITTLGLAKPSDLFFAADGSLYITEINTIPGSLAFYLWEKTGEGLPYRALIDRMVDLALKAYQEKERAVTSFQSDIIASALKRQASGSKGGKT